MHPADIKALIEKAGLSQSAIARTLKGRSGRAMTVANVHAVIKGHTKSQRVATALSKLIGRPVKDLWPGKYPELEKLQAIQAVQAARPARAAKPAAGDGARPSISARRKAA